MANGRLAYYLARMNTAEKLIVANVAVFVLAGLGSALLGFSQDALLYWFKLPKDFFAFLGRPWTLVTYSFFHSGIPHIFWNMIILFFTGRIFLNLFDGQRFLTVYFLGVILGGLVFLLSYNVFPTLSGANASLIGASAGVTAVLIFICTYTPNQEVSLFGIFNIKLWYLGVFVVLVDLVQIPYGDNIGGRLAHLGGAFLGYFYARQLLNGKDIGKGFASAMAAFAALFSPGKRKAPLKTVHRNDRSQTARRAKGTIDYDKETRQKKIDAILDKISKSGYESLSKAEKDFLFKAGKED